MWLTATSKRLEGSRNRVLVLRSGFNGPAEGCTGQRKVGLSSLGTKAEGYYELTVYRWTCPVRLSCLLHYRVLVDRAWLEQILMQEVHSRSADAWVQLCCWCAAAMSGTAIDHLCCPFTLSSPFKLSLKLAVHQRAALVDCDKVETTPATSWRRPVSGRLL